MLCSDKAEASKWYFKAPCCLSLTKNNNNDKWICFSSGKYMTFAEDKIVQRAFKIYCKHHLLFEQGLRVQQDFQVTNYFYQPSVIHQESKMISYIRKLLNYSFSNLLELCLILFFHSIFFKNHNTISITSV